MKVIIAGGRDFNDYEFMAKKLDMILFNKGENVEIVSGGQCTTDRITGEKYGADYLGELYATRDRHCKLTKFVADWNKYGKSAGRKRNKQMAEYADSLIAFWDGKSKGTKNMIEEARSQKLNVRVIHYDSI